MNASRLLAAAGMTLALAACANDRVWMRSGGSSSDGEIEEMTCAEQAESGGMSVTINGGAGPQTDRFSNRYACLRSRGYKLKSLTSEEAAKLKSLGGVDREIYWNQLLAKNGFAAAAEKPEPAQPQQISTLIGNKPASVQ